MHRPKCKIILGISALLTLAGMQSAWAKNLSLDVYAIPPEPVVNIVKTQSQRLHKVGLESFYTKNKTLPHITLYLTEYNAEGVGKVKQIVSQIAASAKPFTIETQGISVTKSNWAFINIKPSHSLQRIADQVTFRLEPYRAKDPTLPNWVKKYPNKLSAFKRYGSPNVFQNFQPHLTLLANGNPSKLEKFKQINQQKPLQADGTIAGLGVAIVDNHGQPIKILGTWHIK